MKFDVILAMDENKGIGSNGKLPWHCTEDLKKFKTLTMDSILIMGRVTVQNLPYLKNRLIIGISKRPLDIKFKNGNNILMVQSISAAFKLISKGDDFFEIIGGRMVRYKKVFIAGGRSIYKQIFEKWRSNINIVYLSIIKGTYFCDTYIKSWNFENWNINFSRKYREFTFYKLRPFVPQESQYLNILQDVFKYGSYRRGRNGLTKSSFGKTLEFNLQRGFPLLTTKKMFFRGVVEELLFFIRGETDSKILEKKKINIWKGNTNREFLDRSGMCNRKEGIMGPMYGYQWRNFNSPYDEKTGKAISGENKIDQLEKVINDIKNNPTSRRILMTDFNPLQVGEGVLYPCHSIILQFYVDNGFLDMFCYNRSSDLFHGLPFNIASSSLFLTLISMVTDLKPRKIIISLGDAHIYKSHMEVVEKQLNRKPFTFPKLNIDKKVKNLKDLESLEWKDFSIENYNYHPILKVPMIT